MATKGKVLVAMSGGVDSTYAFIKLKEEGYEIAGAYLHIFDETVCENSKCCSLEAIQEVEIICKKLEIPFQVVDAKKEFKEKVMDYFAESYKQGLTPSPCIYCNEFVKWKILRGVAKEMGYDYLATGHYAKIELNPTTQRYEVKRADDTSKDQTYMLWRLSQDDLAHTLLPLSNLKKENVREKMEEYSIDISKRPDSQDICFVDEHKKYTDYLEEYFETSPGEGNIIRSDGKVLGKHKGFWHYTIGQRKGLGIGAPRPLYVLETKPETNEVIVGEKEELLQTEVVAKDIRLVKYADFTSLRVKTKIRLRHDAAPGTLYKVDDDTIKMVFDEPQSGISPGQALVAYEDDSVVAGGFIV